MLPLVRRVLGAPAAAPSSSRPPHTSAGRRSWTPLRASSTELAFALALILDELARHWRDLDEQLRGCVLDAAGQMLGRTPTFGSP